MHAGWLNSILRSPQMDNNCRASTQLRIALSAAMLPRVCDLSSLVTFPLAN